jgi:uncharacterized protein YjdB
MKNVLLTCLSLALSLMAQAQSDTWSVKFSNAIISRYQPTISAMQPTKGWEYSNGIILHGMEKVYLQTGTASYLNYIKAYIDTYVNSSGTIATTNLSTTVDKIQPGVLCLFLYEQTGDIRYKTAATQLRNYLLTSGGFSKTPDGGYWHKNDGNYNNVMMVDGMYMLHPFLAKYGAMFGDTTCTGVATFQLLLLASHVMYSPRTLPKHAWDYTKTKTWASTTTGESTDVWSRGTGWYMMALADVLQYLPTSHYRYARILDLFQRMSAGVAANQHPTTGLWYQVVDKRTETGNWTESSGSGMFVYALKKGVDNGWLSGSTYTPVIDKGWTGLQTQIATLTDGPQIRQFCVASGVVNNTAAYYSLGKTNCPTGYPWSGTQHPHGYCGILMAASEMEFPIVSIPVTGVTLSPPTVAIPVGGTQQLTVTVAPTDATNKTVTWTSSNTAVSTVSTTGLVTAVGAGTANITVTTQDGSYTATSQITASVIAVTGVTVSPSSASLETGATTTLIATVLPTNATNKTVTWSSSNSSVATVSSSGVVTGIGAGSAVITVTTQSGSFTATSAVTVTAAVPCTTIQYQAESGTYTSGTTVDSNYTGYTGTGFINTPNAVGSYMQITVTALIAGTHGLSIRYANGTTVNRTASVAVNGTIVISSQSMAGTGAYSTWALSSFSVNLVAGQNTIRLTALTSNGLANIDRLDMCQKYIPVTGITVSPSSTSLSPGGTQQLTATIIPANASYPAVTWSSDNSSVATVNSSGLVTAIASGTVVITAATTNGLTATSGITVAAVPVTGVSVNPSSANLAAGESVTLSAVIVPANASNKNVSWSSSNPAVANVDASGVVTGISEGVADITATTTDGGLTASCEVTVYNVAVSGVTVSPATATLSLGSTTTLSATVLPANATNKTVTWSSSSTGVATVSTSGVVTGMAAGTAVITATTADGGFTANCTVTISASCTATGYITFERWNNITGTAVSNLTSNANYPNSPSSTTTRTLFEIPSNAADNYGCRVSGYICAPLTGNYTFWIAGDDASELWLSTNNLAANKVKIAYSTKYTSSRQWTKYSTQKSAVKYLVQGVTYYVEALMKEGTGSDNLAVGWLKPGQTGTVPSEIIPGSILSPRTPLKTASVQSGNLNPENLNPGTLDVYPNPAKGEVTLALSENLSGKKMVFAVLDMSGQVLMKKEKTVGLTETIDLHGLVSGIYMIRVNCEGFSANKIISVIQ